MVLFHTHKNGVVGSGTWTVLSLINLICLEKTKLTAFLLLLGKKIFKSSGHLYLNTIMVNIWGLLNSLIMALNLYSLFPAAKIFWVVYFCLLV